MRKSSSPAKLVLHLELVDTTPLDDVTVHHSISRMVSMAIVLLGGRKEHDDAEFHRHVDNVLECPSHEQPGVVWSGASGPSATKSIAAATATVYHVIEGDRSSCRRVDGQMMTDAIKLE